MGKVRDAFLNAQIHTETVQVTLNGVTIDVEVREKTVREQYDLIDKCRIKSGPREGEIDGALLAIETIIATAYEPGTDDKAFEPADRDMLMKSPSDAFQTLLSAANRAAGLTEEAQVVADLDETPGVESSSE